MIFYLLEEQHTLASALRTALESSASEEEFISCSALHPLDNFLEIHVPSEKVLRDALLDIKQNLHKARISIRENS
tara:strand:+ start:364 stop:588 length:225 start_codon:yes stop_codon:yes gene_type:complete